MLSWYSTRLHQQCHLTSTSRLQRCMSAKLSKHRACRGRSPCCRAIFMDSCRSHKRNIWDEENFLDYLQIIAVISSVSHWWKVLCQWNNFKDCTLFQSLELLKLVVSFSCSFIPTTRQTQLCEFGGFYFGNLFWDGSISFLQIVVTAMCEGSTAREKSNIHLQ